MSQDPNSEDYNPVFCRALYDYKSGDPSALSLRTGDVIEVLTQQPSGWWDGLLYDTRGWFPSNYVAIIPDEEVDEVLSRLESYSGRNLGPWPTIQPDHIAISNGLTTPQQTSSDEPLVATSTSQNNTHQSDFWIPDVASDGHIYYVNTKTGLRSRDLPTDTEEENVETVVLRMLSTRLETSANPAFVTEEIPAPNIAIEEKGNDVENLTSLYPAVELTPPSAMVHTSSFRPSLSRVSEDPLDGSAQDNRTREINQFTLAFQQAMEPQSPSPNLVHELSCVAQDAIRDVIYNIQSAIVNRSPNIDQIMDGLVYDVVLAVRNLLYIATALPDNQISATSYNGRIRDTRTLSLSQHPKAYQRRVTAILSRLVLSVRALMYNSGSSLADTGNRIKNDAEELLKDVKKFVVDIDAMEESRQIQKNIHTKRLNGVFSVAEVASGLAGGGSAASWKGFGYRNRPDDNGLQLKNLDVDVVQEIELFIEQLQHRSSDLRDVLRSMTISSEFQVCSMVQALITRTSAFLSFIADIYVAQHVDINGSKRPSDSYGETGYHSMEIEAAYLVRHMEAVVQAIYDDSSSLLLATQTLQQTGPNPTIDVREDRYESLGHLLSSLDKQFVLVKRIFGRLLSLSSNQTHIAHDDSNAPLQWGDADDVSTSLEIDINQLQDHDVIDLEASFQRINLPKKPSLGRDVSHALSSKRNNSVTSDSSFYSTQTDVNDDTGTIDEALKSPSRPTTNKKLERILGDEYADKLAADLRPWYLRPNYAPSDIIIDADNSVRGGTLSSLVERLTAHDQADSTFTKAFLLTYNSYTTLDQLFDLLVARFRIQQPEKLTQAETEEWVKMKQHVIRTRVINTMKAIVDSTLEQEDGYILGRMKDFLSSDEVSGSAAAKHLLVQIDRLMTQGGAKTLINTNQEPPPIPISPKANKRLQLLDIDPLELARQFTLIESQLYQRIKTTEALQRARVQKGEHDDNISAVIQMSNQIAEWIAECILSKEDARGRAQVIKHLIIVAERCRALHNFSTMSAIVSGLNTPPIRRLKRTWEQVNRRHIALFETCEVVTDSAKTFNKYKSLIASVVPPCIPFLGVFLSTLQFIQDGNLDYISPQAGMINFRKFQKASEIIIEIKRWQTQPYNLLPLPAVISYINASLNKFSGNARATSDYFWALSLAREPKEREDEKMARLLQESGF